MKAFAKLLVPVDYSEYSGPLLKFAVDLALGMEAELLILNVVEPAPAITPSHIGMGDSDLRHEKLIGFAHTYLHDMDGQIVGLSHRSIVREGRAGPEITACAQDEGADLIVMSTHGRSGLARLLMGSTTEAVLRHATVPVLILRNDILIPQAVEHASL